MASEELAGRRNFTARAKTLNVEDESSEARFEANEAYQVRACQFISFLCLYVNSSIAHCSGSMGALHSLLSRIREINSR